MKTIKKIAVAIDFSNNSRAAYKYAKGLAKHVGAELALINIYSIPINPYSENGFGFIPDIDQEVKATLTALRRFAHDKTVKCAVYTGFPAKELVKLSKEKVFDLLIVGNNDERGLLTQLFGSVAIEVAKKAHCPVLLVPPKSKYMDITDIVYTTSELSASGDGIAVTKDWAKVFDAKIHFVHVESADSKGKMPDIAAFMKDSNIDYAVKDLEFVTVRGAIDNYCEQKHIGLIVSMTQNHSFWDSIFHRSVTSALAWNSRLPLLVLHKDVIEAHAV